MNLLYKLDEILLVNFLNNYFVCLFIGYILEKYIYKFSEDINIIR